MIDQDVFLKMVEKHSRAEKVSLDDVLFGEGLDIGSMRFTEMIMDIEEEYDLDIDVSTLNASIKTVGQLLSHLKSIGL